MRSKVDIIADEEVRLHLVETPADVEEVLKSIDFARPLAIDIETADLDMHTTVRTVQVGQDSSAFAMPAGLARPALSAIDAHGTPLVGHNITFDLNRINAYFGHHLFGNQRADTLIMSHLAQVQTKSGSLGLKDLSKSLIDSAADDGQAELKALMKRTKTDWATVDITAEEYWAYGCKDTLLCLRLYELLRPRMAEFQALYEHETALAAAIADMEYLGIAIDQDMVTAAEEQFTAQLTEATATLTAAGISSPNKASEIIDALQSEGIADLTGRTATDKIRLDAEVLEAAELAGSPLARAIMQARRAIKWRTAYITPLVGKDVIHASIRPLAARTARMSVSNPPLQQLPARAGDIVRRCFRARPGKMLVGADYSQIELRVLAALSGDEGMIQAIIDEQDLHGATAARIFGPNYTNDQRQACKAANFALIYGGGASAVARTAGCSVAEAQDLMAGWHRSHRAASRWLQGTHDSARSTGMVTTASGRRLRVSSPHAAANYVIQSTARDILAESIVRLHYTSAGDGMLLPIHDEILFELPEHLVDTYVDFILEKMNTTLIDVPITASATVFGKSWSTK